MMNPAFDQVIGADAETRLGLFNTTAQRLGSTPSNIEKDFWVCWTLDALFNGLDAGAFAVDIDLDDQDGQSLLLRYPAVTADDPYVHKLVKIESGAKSALDPHQPRTIRPYADEDLPGADLAVAGVVTVDPERTFWDKVVILHGLRRAFDAKGVLRGEGQRVSRHYYDIHRLMESPAARGALGAQALGADCVAHARLFFNRPDADLASAQPGSFALAPHDDMIVRLARDYAAMSGMIFGAVPDFEAVLSSVTRLEAMLNAPAAT